MKNIPLEKLEEKCVDLLTTTYISLGQYKYDPETLTTKGTLYLSIMHPVSSVKNTESVDYSELP